MLLISDPGYKMPERTFKILACVGRVPMMASCTGCQQKFFITRNTFRGDPVGAEEYLREKYVRHECSRTSRVVPISPRHVWKTD
jgi:hypothetical protein